MSTMSRLSAKARELLETRLAGGRVEVTDETRPTYRELADAGMMMPLHTFLGGNESAYRLTEAACALRDAERFSMTSTQPPLPEESLLPAG